MKHFGSLCILLILVHFSTQIPKFENCSENIITDFKEQCNCCEIQCSSSASGGIEIATKICAESHCTPGTQIGYQEQDNTKMYPDCCGYPICS